MEQLIRLQEKGQLESSEHAAVFENVRGNLKCSEFFYVAIPMVYVSVSLSFLLLLFFFFGHKVYGNLVSRSGMEPSPPALKHTV